MDIPPAVASFPCVYLLDLCSTSYSITIKLHDGAILCYYGLCVLLMYIYSFFFIMLCLDYLYNIYAMICCTGCCVYMFIYRISIYSMRPWENNTLIPVSIIWFCNSITLGVIATFWSILFVCHGQWQKMGVEGLVEKLMETYYPFVLCHIVSFIPFNNTNQILYIQKCRIFLI